MSTLLYSAGHGNRTLAEFLGLLEERGVRCVVDVRTVPRSLKHPHFAGPALEECLRGRGVAYAWEGPGLGGFRRKSADSPHRALRSPGFRNYADHMGTGAFREAAARLLCLAAQAPTAFLCAERLPWRCHRYLLSDYLVFRGARVLHLLAPGKTLEHHLRPIARVEGEGLVYDREG